MAGKITNPTSAPQAASTGYVAQNTVLYAQMAGYNNLSLSNMDNSDAPIVLKGSVVEINAALYSSDANESISWSGTSGTGQNYVYAVPSDSGATFQYSSAPVTWNATKGGWYNGNNRAVAVFYYDKSKNLYIGKKIMENIPKTQYPDFSRGATGSKYGEYTASAPVLIPKGIYRVVAIGAGGSAGSSAGTYDDDRPDARAGRGGSGSSGEMIDDYIKLDRDTRCYIVCGKGGVGPKTPNTDTFGKPGKRGGNTEVHINGKTIIAYGGAGGASGARWGANTDIEDGESSEVANGGISIKSDGNNSLGAPGAKKDSWINIGDGLKDGGDPGKGNTGGGINGKSGGKGGNYDSIDGGDGQPGCGGGSPYADTYAGAHGNGGKAGDGGDGYAEFWKMP